MKLTKQYIRSLILKRRRDANKGDFGHVLIIAGSRGMTGAAVLCANGALRSGAGLVTVAVPESQQEIVAKNIRPEAMTIPMPEKNGGFSLKAYQVIFKFLSKRKVSALVLGPGIGRSPEIIKLVNKILISMDLPIVLDADGLNAASSSSNIFKKTRSTLIITPHPGEFSRLTGITAETINKNRIKTAKAFAGENKLICVLKGYKTVISDGKKAFENTTGNPGMASGGMGDVLSGMIAAFIPHVKEPALLNAALCAVFLHGFAGDIAADEKTTVSLLAKDLAESIPKAVKTMNIN